jgi:Flp pilus assembly protein CpaB
MRPPPLPWRDLQRRLAAHRRLVASVLAGLAVLTALSVVRPAPPPAVTVLTAAHDLPAGAVLVPADLARAAVPVALVPSGALRPGAAVVGRVVAGAVRRGEPLTDVRLLGPSLLASVSPGSVAVPVRFADPAAVALLRPGDRIDVLAAPEPSVAGPPGAASVVATGVLVLAVGARDSPPDAALSPSGAGGDDGGVVVVACTPEVARALAAAAVGGHLSPALRGPP